MQNTKLVISFADVKNVNKCNIMGKFEDFYEKANPVRMNDCNGCVFDGHEGCLHPNAIQKNRSASGCDCSKNIWVKKQIDTPKPEIANDNANFEDLYEKYDATNNFPCLGCVFDSDDGCQHPKAIDNRRFQEVADCEGTVWVKKQISPPQAQPIETPSNKEGQFLLLAQNGSRPPRFVHKDIDSAINEAHRLAVQTNGSVKILEVVGEVNRTVVLGVQLNSKFGIENYTKEVNPDEELPF